MSLVEIKNLINSETFFGQAVKNEHIKMSENEMKNVPK